MQCQKKEKQLEKSCWQIAGRCDKVNKLSLEADLEKTERAKQKNKKVVDKRQKMW